MLALGSSPNDPIGSHPKVEGDVTSLAQIPSARQ